MITEYGSDWYKGIVRELEACGCHVCRRGAEARTRDITGESAGGVCSRCNGDGVMDTDEGKRTCSSCLGS